MRTTFDHHIAWVMTVMIAFAAITAGGCSRAKYRLQADHEAYYLIAEKTNDPRWTESDYSIEIDSRSRFYDGYDPDKPPMPEDDPTSHHYMHNVNGMKGWKYWHENGERLDLENTAWRDALSEYVEIDENGAVKLDIDSAMQLAYVHSPSHQNQLETLYLSALDVSAERFRLDTQFFGGYDTKYVHNGSTNPPQLSYSTTLKRFVITPAIDGVESNRLTIGKPFGPDPALQASRKFATAGQLLAGFANSFVFEFTGGDANLTTSLANFSFIQPLLRGAGRDIALEDLTFEERKLLANLRAYTQYRQGFYTQVAIGELGVTGPQRSSSSTRLQSFSGQGGVNGYLGLLQQFQQIRNSEDNLSLQLRTLNRLEALYDNDLMTLVQVDQFRQSVEVQRAELLDRTNALELALDNYETGTLGLPSSLPIEVDQSLIRQFQLIPRESSPLLESLLDLQRQLSLLPAEPMLDEMNPVMTNCLGYIEPATLLFDNAREELAKMEAFVPTREATMTEEEKELFRLDRERLHKRLEDLITSEQLGFNVSIAKIETLRDNLSDKTTRETLRGVTAWVGEFMQVVERLTLVPAQARLEMITVKSVDLGAEDALQIALTNRLDFMNGRAALVDRWRMVQIKADALQSILNVTASGDIRTARNNPVSFRAPTGSLRMGLEFDAPFTRLLERNAYRESLITYQKSRRDFIQSRDSLEKGLRALIRNLEQRRQQLEIQRRAVTIAMRRVDQTQLSLSPPRAPVQPGVRSPINQTTAINLLSAQSSLQSTQNSFLGAWLNYYATRLRLYRELGIMELDPEGRWIERSINYVEDGETIEGEGQEVLPLPPMVPTNWIENVDLSDAGDLLNPVDLPSEELSVLDLPQQGNIAEKSSSVSKKSLEPAEPMSRTSKDVELDNAAPLPSQRRKRPEG
ncbi:MAG: hypothetical protein COA78_03055 [Blastopirellula sp.]|nr:MAG: hypothetical protein COA78_03055 [Blastopirellula sp.]